LQEEFFFWVVSQKSVMQQNIEQNILFILEEAKGSPLSSKEITGFLGGGIKQGYVKSVLYQMRKRGITQLHNRPSLPLAWSLKDPRATHLSSVMAPMPPVPPEETKVSEVRDIIHVEANISSEHLAYLYVELQRLEATDIVMTSRKMG
jgi:hypothetical protein